MSRTGSAAAETRPASSSSTPATEKANIRLANLEVARLLSLVQVPADAVALAKVPAQPPAYTGAIETSKVVRSLVWRVPLAVSVVARWIQAHPPALITEGTWTESSRRFSGVVYIYYEPSVGGELFVQVANAGLDATVIRADAVVWWLDPVPQPDSASGPRIRITVSGGCPRSLGSNVVGVTNHGHDLRAKLLPMASPTGGLECSYLSQRLDVTIRLTAAQARAVVARLARLPLAHSLGGAYSCPADLDRTDVIALSYPGRADVDVWVEAIACGFAANGFIMAGELGSGGGGPACMVGGWAACLKP